MNPWIEGIEQWRFRGLRARPLRRFPHIVFYVEMSGRIDVWRVLHGARDIPAWMRESDG
jgi:toxin ParE1/3/4